MTTQMTNQPLGPMDDLLLTLSEASARTVLTVETLRQRAKRRQLRTVKGKDDRVAPRPLSRDVDQLAIMRPTSRTVRSSVAGQFVQSSDAAVLEHTTAILREQAELIAWLSEELVEERRRRGMAESTMTDLQGQLAELERNLSADAADLAAEGSRSIGMFHEMPELAEMEDQAKDWRKRSRRRPRSARRWLRRSMKRLLTLWAVPKRR